MSQQESKVVPKVENDVPVDDKSQRSNDDEVLKKGPWAPDEDKVLIEYVHKHGEGNWNAVRKRTKLRRCGKSCRLRWANHLKPDLKKGAFSAEEENMIIKLHAKLGNKWAHMATFLPGRTDNEIKNYWNTRRKRFGRGAVPLYPPDVIQCDNQQNHSNDGLKISGKRRRNENSRPDNSVCYNNISFPELKPNTSSLLQSSFSVGFDHQPTFFQGSEELLPSYTTSSIYSSPSFDVSPTNIFEMDESNNLGTSYDAAQASHSFLNGNLSSSQSLPEIEKAELPSLQYNGSGPNDSIHYPLVSSLMPEDAYYVRSPENTITVPVRSEHIITPRAGNDGLLDTVINGRNAVTMKNEPIDTEMSPHSSDTPLSGLFEGSASYSYSNEWETYTHPDSHFECVSKDTVPIYVATCEEPQAMGETSCEEHETVLFWPSEMEVKSEATAAAVISTVVEEAKVHSNVILRNSDASTSNEFDWYSNSTGSDYDSVEIAAALFVEDPSSCGLSDFLPEFAPSPWRSMAPAQSLSYSPKNGGSGYC